MKSVTLQPTTDILDHAQELHKAARTVASDLRTEAANQFGTFKDQAGSRFSDAQGLAEDGVEAVKGFIKERPLTALGIGVFAGLLLASWAFKR